ncbi:MAG TPA: glycosyltransferase family 4 protein [Caldilineae bacterium]|nr:glycosyltransferase family 4 protein [Caldilineae bacterium]
MRILLFGPYPFLGKPISGGVMAVVHALARGLSQRPGLEVAVAAAHVESRAGVDRDGPITIFRLPVTHRSRLRWRRRLRRGLLDIADDFQPDLIHAHGTGYYAAAALDGVWPNVITAHGIISQEAALSGASTLKERLAWQYDAFFEDRVLRRIQNCIAISPYVRRAFARYRQIRWWDIENPIDDDCFDVTPRPQVGRLLSAARIIPRKGVDALISAFGRVAAVYPQAQLRLAGEITTAPDYVAHCRRLVANANLEARVHFLGNLSHADLLEEFSRAQASVLAARQETAPVAVAESLATGCPVVATRTGGVPDMVEPGQTGLLVPPDDPVALASALDQCLRDPAQTGVWGQNARFAAERYRLERIVDKTLAVYEQSTV